MKTYKEKYVMNRDKEIFFNEFFSVEKMIELLFNTGINLDLDDESTNIMFFDVYENCSFLATSYEYDRICLGSDILDLHAAFMFTRFMKS
jgi:hypothetical protein